MKGKGSPGLCSEPHRRGVSGGHLSVRRSSNLSILGLFILGSPEFRPPAGGLLGAEWGVCQVACQLNLARGSSCSRNPDVSYPAPLFTIPLLCIFKDSLTEMPIYHTTDQFKVYGAAVLACSQTWIFAAFSEYAFSFFKNWNISIFDI